MYCRSCKTELADGAIACTGCGKAPLNGNTYCFKCGEQTDPQAVMCVKCGAALGSVGGGLNFSSSSDSNRLVVAICAILLGSLGVHKFLLGYTKEGIITLVISICTCGFGAVVMQVIGIVEGITYLQKSDQDFNNTYVVNKKPWF